MKKNSKFRKHDLYRYDSIDAKAYEMTFKQVLRVSKPQANRTLAIHDYIFQSFISNAENGRMTGKEELSSLRFCVFPEQISFLYPI